MSKSKKKSPAPAPSWAQDRARIPGPITLCVHGRWPQCGRHHWHGAAHSLPAEGEIMQRHN